MISQIFGYLWDFTVFKIKITDDNEGESARQLQHQGPDMAAACATMS
jgi:hypothetical protein